MKSFIYFPCSKSGRILKGFCPTIADGTSMLRDVCEYRKFSKRFGIKYYAFAVYDDSFMTDGIDFSCLSIVKL